MRYCAPRGLPHSVFLSWSPDDQDKALAWLIDEESRCSECGTVPAEWLAADGKKLAVPPPYEADVDFCGGCAERGRYEKHVNGTDGPDPGMKVVMRATDMSEYPEARRTDRLVPLD
jgi:hypothetical protein